MDRGHPYADVRARESGGDIGRHKTCGQEEWQGMPDGIIVADLGRQRGDVRALNL